MNGKIRQIKFFPSQNLTIEHIFCTNESEIKNAFFYIYIELAAEIIIRSYSYTQSLILEIVLPFCRLHFLCRNFKLYVFRFLQNVLLFFSA